MEDKKKMADIPQIDKPKKVLVTGVRGQLGYDVVKELERRGILAVPVGRQEMDITEEEAVRRVILEAGVDAIIHCAAYNAVDKAQEEEENCRQTNVTGTKHIATMAKELGIKLLYVSTDYVFDGSGKKEWTEDDLPAPLSIYGQSKYDAECVVKELVEKFFIVRISWAFGVNGNNFVKTMIQLSKTKDSIEVVKDQVGSPTFTSDLARLLVDMIETEKYGIYHATNEGFCSWYEFACEIFRMTGKTITVKPIKSANYKTKAKRPLNSRLCKDKLEQNGFQRLPYWHSALERYLAMIGETSLKHNTRD